MVGFTDTWNTHCGVLPRVVGEVRAFPAINHITQALDAAGDDLALLGRAIARAAADELYQQRRFGFETFCRHVDRWLDDRDVTPAPAPRAPRPVVGATPPDFDEQLRMVREARERITNRQPVTHQEAS